jgi:hypothetical protein
MFYSSQRLDPDTELPELAAAIAGLPAAQPGRTGLATGLRVRALLTLRRRLDAHLLAELDSFDTQGGATAYGFPTTQSWLRAYGNLDHGIAASMVASARLARRLPTLGDVLATGGIGVEHLAAITRSTRHIPEDVVAEHEATLGNLAPHARPSDLARAGQKITDVYQHDTLHSDPDYLGEARRLSLAQTIDGIWSLDGQLTPEDGAKLAAALEPLTRKRGPEDERTAPQRRADALGDLVDIALRCGQLPQAGGDRTRLTLLVHITEQALAARAAATAGSDPQDSGGQAALSDIAGAVTGTGPGELFAGSRLAAAFGDGGNARQLLGSHAAISPEALQRIGCDADVNIAHLDPTGEILHLGRSTRFASTGQVRALTVRDQGCVFPGCDKPPARCQAHHLRFWFPDGPTDLPNLALVCAFHHWLIHDRHWQLERIPAGPAAPTGGWQATSPTGLTLRRHRKPAA